MQTLREAPEPVEAYTAGEERSNRMRGTGLLLAPITLAVLLVALFLGLSRGRAIARVLSSNRLTASWVVFFGAPPCPATACGG